MEERIKEMSDKLDFFWVKLKEPGQSARTFVGEAAKDAKGNVVDVVGRLGSMVKSRWSLLQQPSIRHAVQDCFLSLPLCTFLRKSMSETKEKVAIGKTKFKSYLDMLGYCIQCKHA
ncbi:hypothetical protein AAG906_003285 [Vitis piasezkii]